MLLAFSPNLQKRWTTSRFWRGLSAVNDCSAHDWGQTARQEGKICSHFGSPALLMKLACLMRSDRMRDEIAQVCDLRFGVFLCFPLHFSLFPQD